MEALQRFSGKVVLVTGASRGIGEAIALRFAAEKATLVLCADEERVHEVAENIRRLGNRVLAYIADVADKSRVDELFTLTFDELGALDVSIHNAGVISISKFDELSEQEWQRVMDINLKGVFLCCQAAARIMVAQGHGRIINAASGQSRQARPYSPHYAASKAGVVSITQSLAIEMAPHGITVNAYCPGIIQTDMWEYNDREWGRLLGGYAPGEYLVEIIKRVPLARPGTPEEVAGVVAFLASDDASYVTGQAINVNGGSIMS